MGATFYDLQHLQRSAQRDVLTGRAGAPHVVPAEGWAGCAPAGPPAVLALPGFPVPAPAGGLGAGAAVGPAGAAVLPTILSTQLLTKYCARAGLNQGTEWPASSRVAKVRPP